MGELPPKLFFRIGEVAGLVGVEPHVLRYWEREFRSIRPTKSAKGQRVYSRRDVENLLRVRDLLYRDGFTIAGAKKKLQRGDEPVIAVDEDLEAERAPEALGLAPAATDTQRDVAPAGDLGAASPEEPDTPSGALKSADSADMREGVASETLVASTPPRVREKLVALRSEIEAFLAELTASGRR